jgi:hypothetical protein
VSAGFNRSDVIEFHKNKNDPTTWQGRVLLRPVGGVRLSAYRASVAVNERLPVLSRCEVRSRPVGDKCPY